MLSILERELGAVRQGMTAVTRARRGDFGVCQGCGLRIASKGLKGLPEADLCLGCQQDDERGERL